MGAFAAISVCVQVSPSDLRIARPSFAIAGSEMPESLWNRHALAEGRRGRAHTLPRPIRPRRPARCRACGGTPSICVVTTVSSQVVVLHHLGHRRVRAEQEARCPSPPRRRRRRGRRRATWPSKKPPAAITGTRPWTASTTWGRRMVVGTEPVAAALACTSTASTPHSRTFSACRLAPIEGTTSTPPSCRRRSAPPSAPGRSSPRSPARRSAARDAVVDVGGFIGAQIDAERVPRPLLDLRDGPPQLVEVHGGAGQQPEAAGTTGRGGEPRAPDSAHGLHDGVLDAGSSQNRVWRRSCVRRAPPGRETTRVWEPPSTSTPPR